MENTKPKTILGLDLGTNSIGWALIEQNEEKSKILGLGSRIIPMSQDILSDFDRGNSVSQTAERTGFRNTRRLRERHLLRRERLLRVLNIVKFLPEHYVKLIDFDSRPGQFINNSEPNLAYINIQTTKKREFIFKKSFQEMLDDFKKTQPQLVNNDKKIPYDWTIYYLRKKALTTKIEKEELAWLILNFNQKRGYYQLRGEEEEETQDKLVEFYALKVVDIIDSGEKKNNDEVWYNVVLENGWIYRRTSRTPLDWKGKVKEFIVTTEIDSNGAVKKDKEGNERRSFRAPKDDDWNLVKKRTEWEIEKSVKTVGCYIYETLLQNPNQKIKGKLVRTIERKFYKDELEAILNKQKEFHAELRDNKLYKACIEDLYKHNTAHKSSIELKDFTYLFVDDIIFYQRPLKSKKSLIANCQYEVRKYYKDGKTEIVPVKCIAKSHPLFQEFRLWQFIQNLRVYSRLNIVNGSESDVTSDFFKSDEDWTALFEWLDERKEIGQKDLLKYLGLKKEIDQYRWNYVEEKTYPCNETRALILSRLKKTKNIPTDFLSKDIEEALWHILYSIEDRKELILALTTFAGKHGMDHDFVDNFKKLPPFKKDYGAYSAKALKKLLPLLRRGKYWNADDISLQVKERINKIVTGEFDENIKNRTREKALKLCKLEEFQNLPLWLACYIVYDRHSEAGDIKTWKAPSDIENFLRYEFKQHSLRNPIVEQVITETLRVVKDIWQYHGSGKPDFFDEVHIELGREMKNPAEMRKKITERINENENTNLRIKALLMELATEKDIQEVRPYSPNQQEILKIYEEGVLCLTDDIPDDILKISRQAQPTKAQLTRYKLWIDQKYRSPYTGEYIPLSKLFTTAYEIEHIIPQSRYFDDSLSNKVICESEVNKDKDNSTAYEYIKENSGKKIELSFGKTINLYTLEKYERNVKTDFARNRSKLRNLLMADIPESFIARQLNDSRYISNVVKRLLSNIVRENQEQESTSKNVITSNGTITTILKQDWGLNDVWNQIITPRFERLNALTSSSNFGHWANKSGSNIFLTEVPLELQKGFSKKRIDHRHHAMDALVIACATRNHINFLNNEYASASFKDQRFDLRSKLCHKKYNGQTNDSYKWVFTKPWGGFTKDAEQKLQALIVSFKQNNRVINKTVNKYQVWQTDANSIMKKIYVKQTAGDNWAIRKPLHKDTVFGLVSLKFKKTVQLSVGIDNKEMIVNKQLKNKIIELFKSGLDKQKVIAFFKETNYKYEDYDASRVETYYYEPEYVASRVKLNESFDTKKIDSITDTGIRKILLNHLQKEKYKDQNDINGKIIQPEILAFSPDGIDELNKQIVSLNHGKFHHPILKARLFEPRGNKFCVGYNGVNRLKFVEAAKGTNLFFAVYKNDNENRIYESIPLNLVIERQKQKLSPVPEINANGDKLLFYLSPSDLVYIPSAEEMINPDFYDFKSIGSEHVNKIYKVVSFSGTQCFFICNHIANSIVNNFEFSALNKMEKSIEGIMIKEVCWKLKVDRLGNITGAFY